MQSAYAGENQKLNGAQTEILRLLNKSHTLDLPCYGDKRGSTVSSGFDRRDIYTNALPTEPAEKSALLVWLLSLNQESPEITIYGQAHVNNARSLKTLVCVILGIPKNVQRYDFHYPTELRKVDLTPLTIKTGSITPLQLLESRTAQNLSDCASYPGYKNNERPFHINLMNKIRECAAQQNSLETLLGCSALPAIVAAARPTTTGATQTNTLSTAHAESQTDAPSKETFAVPVSAASSLTQASTGVAPVRKKDTQPSSPADLLKQWLTPRKSNTTIAKQ